METDVGLEMYSGNYQRYWKVLAVFEGIDFSEALQAFALGNDPEQGPDSSDAVQIFMSAGKNKSAQTRCFCRYVKSGSRNCSFKIATGLKKIILKSS